MANKTYIVELTSQERQQLKRLINTGKTAAHKQRHARILLLADQGPAMKDDEIAKALGCGIATVERVRKQLVTEGLEAALQRQKVDRSSQRLLDGDAEAHLIALACSQPPKGYRRWTLRLLAERMVALEIVEHCSKDTVQRALKKNELKPWLDKRWCIPPKANAEFVCNMEDVLDVYKRPYDPKRPQVCFDERPKQLVAEVLVPLSCGPGQPVRYGYEYKRNGVANIFMTFEPLAGKRHVRATERRTKKDWAECMRQLVARYIITAVEETAWVRITAS